ncbi:hypothetical protein [Bacillus sp. 3255]|uniref:hypothetical protein n=1 Tax=Bacillus sp. 3255 TaxID=2817904 RepID=UPI00286A5360|nr:hypothetical protein [Bacillus sp. 3255]
MGQKACTEGIISFLNTLMTADYFEFEGDQEVVNTDMSIMTSNSRQRNHFVANREKRRRPSSQGWPSNLPLKTLCQAWVWDEGKIKEAP